MEVRLDPDEAEAMLLLIPLMWASKMFRAHMEFVAEIETMQVDLDELLKAALRERAERNKTH
jgi:hypothetical protein